MEKLRMLLGNALAGFLDLSVGACIASAALAAWGMHPGLWQLAAGSVLGVLPDFDIVAPILLGRENLGNHHTTLMHRPLFLVPAASLCAYLIGGPEWALIAFLCVAWHYLHDTPPLSTGGIAWLWPLDSRYISPWGWSAPHAGGMSHHAWLKKYWLTPSPRSRMEIGAGLMALALALLIAWQ
jgi:hypothetical protein